MCDKVKRIILDIDPGIDDVYALIHFVHAEKIGKVKLEAITCTKGNSSIKNVCKNLVRILEILGRTDIPVYKGASDELIVPENATDSTYFGMDGFGDLKHETEPDLSLIKNEPSTTAMRNIVVSNPKEISLVCMAPLTNVALAIKMYEDFAPNLGEIYIMGGNYKAVINIETTAEFNFFTDPESAYIVFRHLDCPTTILTYEAAIETKISSEWRTQVLGRVENPIMNLLNDAEKTIFKNWTTTDNKWYPFDGFLAAAILFPDEIIVRKNNFYVSVELKGNMTRGQLILSNLKNNEAKAVIIESINCENYKQVLLKAINCI